jgi:hypothetical protein
MQAQTAPTTTSSSAMVEIAAHQTETNIKGVKKTTIKSQTN